MNLIKKKYCFSWRIYQNLQVVKIIDKSFYEYGETVIPIGIRKFFEIEKYNRGDSINIDIVFKDRIYDSKIIFENNFNRSRLKLDRELKLQIQELIQTSVCNGDYYNNKISAIFIKDNSQKYNMALSVEI